MHVIPFVTQLPFAEADAHGRWSLQLLNPPLHVRLYGDDALWAAAWTGERFAALVGAAAVVDRITAEWVQRVLGCTVHCNGALHGGFWGQLLWRDFPLYLGFDRRLVTVQLSGSYQLYGGSR